MHVRQIPFGRPMIDDAEINAVVEIMKGPQLVHGPAAHAFEHDFAARVGARFATSVSSCTAGLHLALFVEQIGPGDEVIVPAMTHVATAHAVELCGAKPVFADVDPRTGNIDPAALAAAITGRTRAVIIVHYLGLPCDMDPISAACDKAGAYVIEDCALAIDATYDGRKAGTLGRVASFSFYPVKHMTTAEGGMVTTDDEGMAAAIAQKKAFGYDRTVSERKKPGIYDVVALGFNYRMNELQAAIGVQQLKKLDRFQAARKENFRVLAEHLDDLDGLNTMPAEAGKSVSSHYCFNAVLPRDGSVDRDAIVQGLKERGIGTSVHYPSAVPLMSYYAQKYGYRTGQFPVAEWLAAQTISLPVGPHLAEGDADYIGRNFVDLMRAVRA